MSDTQTAHCRLCAYSKPYNKLVNLQTDENKRIKLLEQLTRLNIEVTNLDSNDDLLPKTVCFTCIESLDSAFNFVKYVETAQSELNEIISQNVKEEPENYMITYEFEDTYDTTVTDDSVSKDINQNKNKPNSNNLKKDKNDTDESDTPLSDLKMSWRDHSWICAYCETMFPNIDELKTHAIHYHGCCNAYKCVVCKRRVLKLDRFIVHVQRHKQTLKRSCYKCHLVFPNARRTYMHRTTHLNSEHKCPGCNETFLSLTDLTKHCEAYNKDKKSRGVPVQPVDDFTCMFCKKTFKSKGGMNAHLLTHTKRERNLICEICGKGFFSKQNLEGHMRHHEDSRPHTCEICKQGFRTRYLLRVHISVHDGIKPHSCEQCGRCFRLEKQLISHSIIHTDSLPYVCTVCNKCFRFKSVLNQHLRRHTGVKPYSCQVCQREFTNWPNYNKHMKRRHSMDMAKKKRTPNGPFPINPKTGEVLVEPKTNKTLEWMKKILDGPRKPRRSEISTKDSNVK